MCAFALVIPILLLNAALGDAVPDTCAGDEDSALLQHKRRNAQASRSPSKGMAFEGGGFKAHSAHTGVISALLSAQASAANGGLKQLLGEIKVISSNSGGSWFMSQLAYSPSFLSLVETVAAAPANAHQLYLDGWVIPFIQGLSPFQGDLAPASTRLQSKPLTAHNWTKTGPVRQTNNNRIGDARNARVTEVLFNILEVPQGLRRERQFFDEGSL